VNGGANQASNNFTNLGSGVYTVQVIDANGCSVTSSITISAPNAPIITSAVATDASCQPGNDGTITLTANGGLAPYTYSSNGVNFQVSNVLNGLGVGSYTVQVSDAIGCSATSVVSIINVLSPSVALTNSTDATCIPGCDGMAAFLGSGGSSFVYTYSIDGINFQAGTNFSNLCAGNYTITVKDGNGCTGTSTFTINTFNGPSIASTSTQDILCNGGNNGSLSIVLTGGLGVINYTLLPSNATNTNGQFSTLTAGIYTVNASDVNGCTVSTIIQLNEPLPLQFSNLIANPSLCNGSGNGSIDVTTQGGTPQVSFAISPAATFVPPSIYVGLTGNSTYTVTATDANGCTLTSSVFVAQPQLLVINTATATDITCNGLVNGILNTSASGGTGLLTYSILPSAANNTTGVFNGLGANTYTITVTDINNCTATSLLQINEPTAITIDTILIQDETCTNTGNASIVITCSGGTGILNYTLQPTNITNTTGSFLNLSGNTYTVLVTDANGCSYTTLANVNNPLPIVYSSATSTNVLCNGGSTGTLTLSATGGTGLVYTYTLMPGAVSNTSGQFLNLPIGNYTITASDVNLCTTTTILTITEPPALVGTFISKTDITCYNANNGELSVSASGGSTPYIYTLQPSLTSNSTGIFNGLSANTYSVLITDSNLCTTLVPGIQIVNPPLLTYTQVTHTDITCYGGNTGSISASATGGLGTLNYTISPLNGLQNTPGQFTNLSAGVYTVMVTDGNNCTATTLVSILQNPQIKIDEITYIEPICWGEANGKINIVASGGVGALSYQLNIGGPQATGYYTNLLAGGYSITIRDSLGCLIDTMYVLTQPEPVYFKELDVLPVYCIGASNGKIIVKGSGGRGGYKYYLSPGLYINTTGIFSGLHEGIYTMTIKDSAGCHFDSTIVIGPPLNPFGITTTHKNLGCYGTGVEGWAEVVTSGGEPPYTYLWSTSPVQYGVRAENLYFGYYFVEVTDGSGCVAKDTVYIEPGPCCEEVFVPNAFSPNGDGNNDIFRVTSSAGIELIQFDVYDRWGNRVWSTNDFRSGWDGTYKGKTESMDTYFYVFRYKCLTDGENYIKKGDIMLMR
jgi:gliding motility-associated-like protein